MPEHCVVRALYQYPVKSCRGTAVDAVALSPLGIDGDRQLMIVDAGKFTNQARLPKLATVATTRIDDETIEFAAAGRVVRRTIDRAGTELQIDFYGNPVAVLDQGDELAELLSAAVGAELRAVALKETFTRAIPLDEFALVDGGPQSRFVDVAPILVTNTASLDDLNDRLDAPVPMNRFRPNVVIEGLEAFGEDAVVTLEGDGVKLARMTHCERCAVTCTDQESGERAREPLATLRAYRHREGGYAGGVMFGAYMAVQGSGTLRVGDQLRVVRTDA